MTRKDFKTNDDFKGSAIYLVRDIAIRIRSSPVYLTMEHGMKFRKGLACCQSTVYSFWTNTNGSIGFSFQAEV